MNNLEYICKFQQGLVGSILEDLAAEDRFGELDATLANAEIPEMAMKDCASMMEWLDEERTIGAWQPADCVADIVRDVEDVDDSYMYLERRGIEASAKDDEKWAWLAAKDISMRWTSLYASAVKGPIFESNFNRRCDELMAQGRWQATSN